MAKPLLGGGISRRRYMSLEERIESEFKAALKKQDKIKLSTLRMLKADINNLKLQPNKDKLTDSPMVDF